MSDLGVELSFELRAGLQSLRDEMAAERAARRAWERSNTPVFYRPADTGKFPSSGILVLRLQGPDQGHFWLVRSITVSGLLPTSAEAGRADIFVSASDLRTHTTLADLPMADWRDFTTTIGAAAPYTSEQLPLRFNEELYVVISSGTPTHQYVASAQVTDYEELATAKTWRL